MQWLPSSLRKLVLEVGFDQAPVNYLTLGREAMHLVRQRCLVRWCAAGHAVSAGSRA